MIGGEEPRPVKGMTCNFVTVPQGQVQLIGGLYASPTMPTTANGGQGSAGASETHSDVGPGKKFQPGQRVYACVALGNPGEPASQVYLESYPY